MCLFYWKMYQKIANGLWKNFLCCVLGCRKIWGDKSQRWAMTQHLKKSIFKIFYERRSGRMMPRQQVWFQIFSIIVQNLTSYLLLESHRYLVAWSRNSLATKNMHHLFDKTFPCRQANIVGWKKKQQTKWNNW